MALLRLSSLASANIFLCESVIREREDFLSAMRLLTVLSFTGKEPNRISFKAVTMVTSHPGDGSVHTLQLQMQSDRTQNVAAITAEFPFVYGYKIDPAGAGVFMLTTDFTLELQTSQLGNYTVNALLDGEVVAHTPIMLRRG